MSVMGLLGGALKGLGAGMQADIEYQREMALEEIRAQRRQAERQQDRGWAVEDRDAEIAANREEWAARTDWEVRKEEGRDKRATEAEEGRDRRSQAQINAMMARIDGRSEGQTPADVKSAEWLAGLEERAAGGDQSAQRTIDAYKRVTQSKTSDASLAKDRAKMIIETAKDLNSIEGGMDGEPYEKRKAKAESIVDDLLRYGGPSDGAPAGKPRMERPAPATQQGAPNAPAGAAIPQGAIDMLRNDPNLARQFDAKYGAGASARYLKQ